MPVHIPALQVCPIAQTRPHAPQLLLSVCVFTQVPEQLVCPALHIIVEGRHVPAVHVCPAGQTLPQAPQLLTSVWVLTQRPPHSVSAPVHIGAAHVPIVQTKPAAHA
jgi:hypothetical protein